MDEFYNALPPGARKGMYVAFTVVGAVVIALNAWFTATVGELPAWMDGVMAVYTALSVAFGITAFSNTPSVARAGSGIQAAQAVSTAQDEALGDEYESSEVKAINAGHGEATAGEPGVRELSGGSGDDDSYSQGAGEGGPVVIALDSPETVEPKSRAYRASHVSPVNTDISSAAEVNGTDVDAYPDLDSLARGDDRSSATPV